jgi:DUF2075 family protein/SOS-response transcriptional repressor LexA
LIVYQRKKHEFLDDAFKQDIEAVILEAMAKRLGRRVGDAEVRSWRESLTSMAKVLNDDAIPAEAGVAIEYAIPQTSKRIDFILSGRDESGRDRLVIVELKQWESARRTERDGIVVTRFQHGEREVSHPSYQAWSYAALMRDFNEAVHEGGIELSPCAYLHNYVPDGVIDDPFYAPYIERAPVFLRGDAERGRLRAFIARWLRTGDDGRTIWRIENGRIRPSRSLADSLVAMLDGKPEFVLVDDQKVVYETAISLAHKAARTKTKQVLLVEGGPGTGKSVLAINLLATLTSADLVCRYVSKNAAPRAVYEARLTGQMRATRIRNLFSGSGAFVGSIPDSWDVLIVDEAHRLNEKSGLYSNLGEHQGREIISAARCVVFFVDDDQRVTLKDVGRNDAIRAWALELGAEVTEARLESQFRCSGSDGYLSWLDHTLQIRETANVELDTSEFDFRVFDSPSALHAAIVDRNGADNRARVVAGYCWKWVSKRHPERFDIEIAEFGYRRRWNLDSDGSLWIIAPTSVEEVGCIHTCQGLEVDVVGVIVGPDLIVRQGRVVTRPDARASTDKSLHGLRALAEADPDSAARDADAIIKNTYRTLMTRGMKGCWIYCTDPETADWFRSSLSTPALPARGPATLEMPALPVEGGRRAGDTIERGRAREIVDFPFEIVPVERLVPWKNALPLVELELAAGGFGQAGGFDPSEARWVEPPEWVKPAEGLFVARVVGESMNRRVPNGAWCVFRANPQGTRNGKVVVAQHRAIDDPELGGSFTVKVYSSEKGPAADGTLRNTLIRLSPDSTDPRFGPIEIHPEEEREVAIIAELLGVVG